MANADPSLSGAATTAQEQPLIKSESRKHNSCGSGGIGVRGQWKYQGVAMTPSGEVTVGDGAWDQNCCARVSWIRTREPAEHFRCYVRNGPWRGWARVELSTAPAEHSMDLGKSKECQNSIGPTPKRRENRLTGERKLGGSKEVTAMSDLVSDYKRVMLMTGTCISCLHSLHYHAALRCI